jgi:hypothetical protein
LSGVLATSNIRSNKCAADGAVRFFTSTGYLVYLFQKSGREQPYKKNIIICLVSGEPRTGTVRALFELFFGADAPGSQYSCRPLSYWSRSQRHSGCLSRSGRAGFWFPELPTDLSRIFPNLPWNASFLNGTPLVILILSMIVEQVYRYRRVPTPVQHQQTK